MQEKPSPNPTASARQVSADTAAERTIESFFSDIIGSCDPLAARSLLISTIRILDQDTKLGGLLAALPSGEFRREFFAKAGSALAEAFARFEEMHERFEADAEYRDVLLDKFLLRFGAAAALKMKEVA